MKIRDRLFVFMQRHLPQHLLSALMYRLARCEYSLWKNSLIRIFIWKFEVDMKIAAQAEPTGYRHFNDFFTRRLKCDVRPVDQAKSNVVSPVDGVISQAGKIDGDAMLQAKGKSYSLKALLANDESLRRSFMNGRFMTVYLSPRDYHRIHMPLSGRLVKMLYVPGDLFSVNEVTTAAVEQLFARNERIINVFNTQVGTMALIMIGAIFVGSMETVWAGQITPAGRREIKQWDYDPASPEIKLDKGEEMGRFNLGSTVILLFEPGKCAWLDEMKAGRMLRMGQAIGTGSFD